MMSLFGESWSSFFNYATNFTISLAVYDEDPITMDEAHQKAQLKRMLDLDVNPIHGISSKWDRENKKWK